ncbi:MAG TPA: HAD-IA family hydrolase [Polyangiaceae bacterium]|nr:HAD-IA family hydrolase [Polyangiaceae bacterium]
MKLEAVRGIVFDLDGTLIDSRADIARAARHALLAFGFADLPDEEIHGYVGDGARKLLARAARVELDDSRMNALYAAFIEYYAAHPVDYTEFCPGAREALALDYGVPLALCTNKPRVTTACILRELGISERFAVVVAGDDLAKNKPDPLPLLHIAERLEAAPQRLVMVGDGAQDVGCGRAAGARTIGLRGGIQPEARLLAAGADLVLGSLHELPRALSRLDREMTAT